MLRFVRAPMLLLSLAALAPAMDERLQAWSIETERATTRFVDEYVAQHSEAVKPSRERLFDDATRPARDGVTRIVEQALPALQQLIDSGKLVGDDLSLATSWKEGLLLQELAGRGLLDRDQQRKLVRTIEELRFEQRRDHELVRALEAKTAEVQNDARQDREALDAAKAEGAKQELALRRKDADLAAMREDIAVLTNTLEKVRQKMIEQEKQPPKE